MVHLRSLGQEMVLPLSTTTTLELQGCDSKYSAVSSSVLEIRSASLYAGTMISRSTAVRGCTEENVPLSTVRTALSGMVACFVVSIVGSFQAKGINVMTNRAFILLYILRQLTESA